LSDRGTSTPTAVGSSSAPEGSSSRQYQLMRAEISERRARTRSVTRRLVTRAIIGGM